MSQSTSLVGVLESFRPTPLTDSDVKDLHFFFAGVIKPREDYDPIWHRRDYEYEGFFICHRFLDAQGLPAYKMMHIHTGELRVYLPGQSDYELIHLECISVEFWDGVNTYNWIR